MTAPLIVLAVLSTIGGFIGVPYALGSLFSSNPVNYIESRLDPVVKTETESQPETGIRWASPPPQPIDGAPPIAPLAESAAAAEIPSPEEIREERLLAGLSFLVALCGIGIGWLIFQKRPLLELPRILENKYYVDEIYDAAIINPIEAGAREGLWKFFDVEVIDGFLHGLGRTVTEAGGLIRYLQTGFVRSYAAIILFGALAIIGYFGVRLLLP